MTTRLPDAVDASKVLPAYWHKAAQDFTPTPSRLKLIALAAVGTIALTIWLITPRTKK